MNRTGRYWPQLFLLLTLLVGLAVAETREASVVDPDVAGVRSFFDDIFGAETAVTQRGNAVRAGRTFGHKRIQFMMMPMIYKMGVMMTMLMVLTVISLKGLMIGVILLVLKLSAIFGKLYASAHSHGYSSGGWQPPPQPVHVHLHNSHGAVYPAHGPSYSGWEQGPPTPDESYYYKG